MVPNTLFVYPLMYQHRGHCTKGGVEGHNQYTNLCDFIQGPSGCVRSHKSFAVSFTEYQIFVLLFFLEKK